MGRDSLMSPPLLPTNITSACSNRCSHTDKANKKSSQIPKQAIMKDE